MGTLSPRAATGALALLLISANAFAQGVVDQQNDPATTTGFGCGSPTPILNATVQQSFVSAQDTLIAVELRLQAGSAFPSGGTVTTARIRDGSSTGTVLAEATASVAGPLSQGTQMLVRFDLGTLSVKPGNTYLIEWVTPPTTELTWVGTTTDPYPAGTAFSCSGNVWPGGTADLNFVTYAPEPPPPPSEEPTCAEMLEVLRGLVAELELRKFNQRAMDRLLELAQRELGRGKPHVAGALVKAVECHVSLLDRVGVITDEEADDILGIAGSFRACLGLSPKKHHGWRWGKHWHKR
jgi:hypothetical protein